MTKQKHSKLKQIQISISLTEQEDGSWNVDANNQGLPRYMDNFEKLGDATQKAFDKITSFIAREQTRLDAIAAEYQAERDAEALAEFEKQTLP